MDINNDIRVRNNEINNLKDECTKELNEINYYYWPIIAKLKKDKKNRIWYFTLSCLLIVIIAVWMIFTEYEEKFIILLAFIVDGAITCVTTIRMIRVIKDYNVTDRIWKKALENPSKMQKNIVLKCEEVKEMMINTFGDKKEEIVKKIGSSYDDILEYYNQWVENN